MPRGNVAVYKVFYKGKNDDYIVFVEDAATVRNWKKDHSIPLAQVVNGWKIFVTHRWVVFTLPCLFFAFSSLG
jgi:hypothetical protein